MTDRPIRFKSWRIWRGTECRILEAIGADEISAAQIIERGRFWLPPYPALARLERRGIVNSRWVDGPYPRRRVYRVREAPTAPSQTPSQTHSQPSEGVR